MSLEGPPEDCPVGAGFDQPSERFTSAKIEWVFQHSVRNLSQFVAKPAKLAEAEVTPHQKCRSKKAEILGETEDLHGPDFLESFSDSDWAGDPSSTKRRRHSVSSTFMFLNGCLIASWSRSQRSIALRPCEAEFLAAAGPLVAVLK